MCKRVIVLFILAAVLINEYSCVRFRNIIHPTYRPPPYRPIGIRTVRGVPNGEHLWLNKGDIPRAPATDDHPFLPNHIDDIKLDPNRRYARSFDSSSTKWSHAGQSVSGSAVHTGQGYNRRQTREIRLPFEPLWRPERPWQLPRPQKPIDPFNPYPRPGPRPLYPIYV